MSYPTQNPEIVDAVITEVRRAMDKFPTWPNDPLHAMGVVREEVGELDKAVLQQIYEPHKNKPGAVYEEALQACAMLLRFLASHDRYVWKHCKQHNQTSLDRS